MMIPGVMNPFPIGWYGAAFSHDLAPEQILIQTVCGVDLVLWRTKAGKVVVNEAHCPHLGAHLGFGGKIKKDRIQCPFHGFSFDAHGKCVTPLSRDQNRPGKSLKVFPSAEQDGLILVFMGRDEGSSVWELPQIDLKGYSKRFFHCFQITAHPQDIAENSVDLLHFKTVHHYRRVSLVEPVQTKETYLKTHYRMIRKGISFLNVKSLEISFTAHLHGLGYSYVDIQIPSLKMEAKSFVWATPTKGEKLDLRIGFTMKEISRSDGLPWALKILPKAFLNLMMQQILFRGFKNDVSQDVPIWAKKTRIIDPSLSSADGPIREYRRWAQQFY